MENPAPWYRGSLPATVDALRAARRILAGSKEAADSVRRIGKNLRQAAMAHGFHRLADAGLAVQRASARDLGAQVDALILALSQLPSLPADQRRPTVLVVEDDTHMSKLLNSLLAGPDRDVLSVSGGKQAMGVLESRPVSLVVLDLTLPDGDGRDLLMQLRERAATSRLPVIVLSGLSGPLAKAECYALGADAYFEKPVAPDVLKAAISARLFRSLEQEKGVRQDALTGLPNREALAENFRRQQNLAERRQEPQALALLDFDKLRPLNEAYGHMTGDAALRHAVKVLLFALRKSDLLCRLEGDTFVLLLPHTSIDGARNAVGKAIYLLRNEPFRAPDGRPILLSVSAGVVEIPAGATLDEALAEADRWLYLAKAAGRGRLMTPRDPAAPVGRQVLLMEPDEGLSTTIEQALRREGFEVLRFAGGADAASAARDRSISLCIADFRPGSHEAQDLLHSLKHSGASRPPVLMLTSTGSDDAVALGYQLGADDYLVKPFTGYELMSRVHSLLRH